MAFQDFEDVEVTVGRLWTPQPGYIPYDQRPPTPTIPLHYANEKLAEAALERLLSPFFTLHRQVRLTETGYPPQIIDYVAELPKGLPFRFFGIEVKRGFRDVKDACDAIQQAMRYRKAKVSDKRDALSGFLGDRPPYVFLWPEFRWAVDTVWAERHNDPDLVRARYLASCSGEARALNLFAARFNVGHVLFEPWWNPAVNEWRNGVVLMNGQQKVWTSRWIQKIEDGIRAGAQHGATPSRGLRYIE